MILRYEHILFALFLILVDSNLMVGQSQVGASKVITDSLILKGEIFDRITTHKLPHTLVEVLNQDSVRVAVTKGGWEGDVWSRDGIVKDSTSNYSIRIPKIEGNYIIRVSKRGYETVYIPYILSNLHRREDNRKVSNIYLRPERIRTLEEFTVKASKVKFYHKGDTLVYNADAFMLPEGSMLDALIAKLPGVEIKENGKIYVNGRFVESLLLNGKDFFKKDRNVVLENIGVYSVKDVAVYEKRDDMAEVLGDRDDVDKELVMDVRLKKEYRIGTMVNAEAGGGTASRYIGRLFLMRYTDNSRLSVYGNANNINRMNRLSTAKQQFERNSNDGITNKRNGGIDYYVENPLKTWEVNGNADMNYTKKGNTIITNSINYLQQTDNFSFSRNELLHRDMSLSTNHNFKLKKKGWNLMLKPSFSYNRNRDNDEIVAATFNQEIQEINEGIVKSIYSGDYRNILSALVNRNMKDSESRGHGYDAEFQGSSRIRIPSSPDAMEIKFTGQYRRKSLTGHTLQDICFGSVPDNSMLRDQSSNNPQYNFKLQGQGRYYFNIPFGSLNAAYEFIHTQNRKNSILMLMQAMAQDGMAEFLPGSVPEFDFENSFTSKLYKNQHILKLSWSYKKNMDKVKLRISLNPKFFLERHNLFYHQADIFASPRRTFTRFGIDDLNMTVGDRKDKWTIWATYKLMQSAPDLIHMIDLVNTTDPLNVRVGNQDLKNKTSQEVDISYFHEISRSFNHDATFHFNSEGNDFVQGYRYDSQTGIRTYKTYNVSGNFGGYLDYHFDYRFGLMKRFTLSNRLIGVFRRYSDMIGYDSAPEIQRVSHREVDENISVGYADERFNLQIGGGVDYSTSRSMGQNLTKNNFGSAQGMFSGSVQLPLNFQLSTDFNILKRFGYIEDSMNDVNFLWNACLEYIIQKGTWRIALNARDILNQNRGIRYYVNATGRTQTLNTVLPRYLMLSVHYRFDFKPKKNI